MDNVHERDAYACAVIDAIGGTAATARLCEVKFPSVSEWRRTGIPRARLLFLKIARPDVFAAISQPKRADTPIDTQSPTGATVQQEGA